jgi:hypothetical protein
MLNNMVKIFASLWYRIYFNVYRLCRRVLYILLFPILMLTEKENEYINQAYGSEFHTTRLTDTIMLVLTAMVFFTFSNLLSVLIGVVFFHNQVAFMFLLLVPGLVVHYMFFWRNNRYLDHFKKFDKESVGKKRKWALISFGIIVVVFQLLFLSVELLHDKKQ